MLTASRLKIREGATEQFITGNNSGKKILCSPQVLPIYNDLVKLSKSGNYWATLIVKAIIGLSAGRLSSTNVYIKQGRSMAFGTGDSFYLVLPGVTATLDQHPNGGYILQHLNVDKNYELLQEQASKPGLWKVSDKINDVPTFQSDGKIHNTDIRAVAISDMSSSPFLLRIIPEVRKSLLANKATEGSVKHYGFDLHHTPGEKGIRGLVNQRKALNTSQDREIVQSAILLANTMYQARNQKGVIWFSDYGGSAILTRALQILKNTNGVDKLEHHSVFMNHPTSKAKEAIAACEAIGLKDFDKKSGMYNPKELIGHFSMSDKPLKKLGAATVGGLTTAGVAFGFMGASLTVAGLVGVAGGLFTVSKTIISGAKNTKLQKY